MNAERAISVMPEPTRGERRKFVAVASDRPSDESIVIAHTLALSRELGEMHDEISLLQRIIEQIKRFRKP